MNPFNRIVSLIVMILLLFSCTERLPVAPEIEQQSPNFSNLIKSGEISYSNDS